MRNIPTFRYLHTLRACTAAAVIAASTYGSTALAQSPSPATEAVKPPDAATKKAARAAYSAGEKAYQQGNYSEAYDSFKKANDLIPNINAQYWMAMSTAQSGKTAEGYDALSALLADPAHDKLGADKLETARAKLDEIKRTPATVTLTTTPPNATVLVDGTEQKGASPRTLDVSAGAHKITVQAEGFETKTLDVNVKPGEKQSQAIELAAAPPAPATPAPTPVAAPPPPAPKPAAPPPPPPAERSKVPGIVTLCVAGASAVVGTIFGIQALGAKSDFDKSPTEKNADDAERNSLIADMAFGATLTLGITGIVLLTSDEPAETPTTATVRKDTAKVELTPYVSPKSGGAFARWKF